MATMLPSKDKVLAGATPCLNENTHSLALTHVRNQLELDIRWRKLLADKGFDTDHRVVSDSMKQEATSCHISCSDFAAQLLGEIRAELAALQTAIIDGVSCKMQILKLNESDAAQTSSEASSRRGIVSADTRMQVTACANPADCCSSVPETLKKLCVVETQRTFEASTEAVTAVPSEEVIAEGVEPFESWISEPGKELKQLVARRSISGMEELKDSPYPLYWYTRRFKGIFGWELIERIIVLWYSLKMPPRTDRLYMFQASIKFELIFAVVIFANFVFQIVRVNNSVEGAKETLLFHIVDLSFGAIFGLECAIKIAATGWYFFVRDGMFWNWLDFILVLMSVIDVFLHTSETGGANVVRVIRFFRLVKTLRVVRVMMLCKTLRTMIDSVLFSIAALFWSILMLVAMCFMFGLAFTQLTAHRLLDDSLDDVGRDTLLSSFGSVQQASLTLFKSTTGGADWGETYDALAYIGKASQWLFTFYICFTHIAVLNIVTGAFVESAMNASELTFDERAAQLQMEHCQAFRALLNMVRHHMVSDDSDSLSLDDLAMSLQNEVVRGFLASHGISIHDPRLLFSVLSRHDETQRITAFDFVSGCLGLRGFTSGNNYQILSFQGSLCHAKMFQLQSHVTTELDNLRKLLLQETSRIGGVSKM
eukprot:TRINITY_DN8737_c0_g1_i7.p1 TRINITY_DN8737_c0_g1~~TRINITY_DN8737_c0_g1_i7.p1  ORF type:complete len:672 (-),score=70.56 TRINITY_DN8737_c0_g1_i7:126-2081(-)